MAKTKKNETHGLNFEKVARLRSTTSHENIIKCILYDLFHIFVPSNAATKYGIQNEPLAKNYLESKLGTEILPCGLFIDKNLPYLAASPGGLVNSDSIVEIKCPASIKDYTPEEAFHEKNLKCMTYNHGNLQLKTSHVYYTKFKTTTNN
ncbi:YqaJ domain-containing protein [Aphis craccivora]|uniref:YqaJ domain-containing protein n=1 Tax=Aphis craccivora TaxID=307492 RepID=A0A6G0VK65_APHCR|nr:YqaJ domain-containing protein [Aphis craccivora]